MVHKQQNFLYFAGVFLSNTLLYAIIVRFALFYIGDGLTNTQVAAMLGLQLLVWFAAKLWQLRDDDNQWIHDGWFVMGGIATTGAALGWAFAQSWPSLFELMLFMVGHIFIQKGFWTQLTTVSSDDKNLLDLRVLLILFFLFLNFLTDIHHLGPLMICGLLGAGHVLVRVGVTGISQLWLIYNEDVLYKSHYHQLVKTFQVNHAVSSSSRGMKKNVMDLGIFVLAVVATGGGLMWLTSLGVVKAAYGALIQLLVSILQFLFGDLIQKFFEYLQANAAKMKPVVQKPKTGDLSELMNTPQAAAISARQEEAQAMLTTTLGVIVVIICLVILFAIARKKTARIKKQLDFKMSSGERLIPEDSWWRSALGQLFGKRGGLPVVQDAFRKKYKKLLVQMKQAGLVVSLSDTPEDLQQKMAVILPDATDALALVTLVYNDLRYGDERHPQYGDALKAVEQLRQMTKKGVFKHGKKTEF